MVNSKSYIRSPFSVPITFCHILTILIKITFIEVKLINKYQATNEIITLFSIL